MSAGEVIHTSSTGGQKAGNDVRMSLLPTKELMEVAELYGKGAKKYDDHNWAKGYAWSLSYDALHRHLAEFWTGHEYDDGEGGTGLQHLTCAAFHVLTLMYFVKHHRAHDDRHIPPAQPVGTIESGLLSYHYGIDHIDGPTTVPSLTKATRDSKWTSAFGDKYKFEDGRWWIRAKNGSDWHESTYQNGDVPPEYGPFAIWTQEEEA